MEAVPQYGKHSTDVLHVNDKYAPVGKDYSQYEQDTEIHYEPDSVKIFFIIKEEFGVERMLT